MNTADTSQQEVYLEGIERDLHQNQTGEHNTQEPVTAEWRLEWLPNEILFSILGFLDISELVPISRVSYTPSYSQLRVQVAAALSLMPCRAAGAKHETC